MQRENWCRVGIADICISIVDCLNRTAPTVNYATPFKMIRTTNVRDGWIDLSSVKYVDAVTYSKWTRRQVPQMGDIVLTREAPLGEVGMIRSNDKVFLGQRLVSYRVDPTKADNRFVLYAFQGEAIQSQIRALGSGSTVEHMRVPDAKLLSLKLPPLQTQRRIASILSAYDDLIENNTRRIAILEEMAKRIYEEWFVHFRAPGCESVPLVDSELGPIPKGWEVVRLDQIIDFDPRIRAAKDRPNAFVPMSSLQASSMIIGKVEERQGNSGSKFQNGDTLLARITPCLENGKTGFVDILPSADAVACGSTEFIVMRGRGVCSEFVQLLARSGAFRAHAIASMSGATGRQRVRRESLEQFQVAKPDDEILRRFAVVVSPMFKLCRCLANANENLRTQRNLLLPKLISGEIDVSEAEQPLLEAAE